MINMPSFVNRKSTQFLIIHCADTFADMDTTAADIDVWHRKRGFSAIGYHYVIRRDGSVETGRPDEAIGAHCKSQGRNRDSVGICMVGGKSRTDGGPEDNFTVAQKVTLRRLVSKLQLKYPNTKVRGHRDFDKSRACPCFDYEAALNGEENENCNQDYRCQGNI